MSYLLKDVFIGNFPKTQDFGANPQTYSARYGITAHNGIDWACPSMTPIISAADGWVKETGFDVAGYGNYVKVIHDGYLTLYAHLNDISVGLKDRVVSGQLLGHSDNTGLSTGPHLHFGVAPCDANGEKTEKANGYSGYIDPAGIRCEWKLTYPTSPVVHTANDNPSIPVQADKFKELVAKSTNLDVVTASAISHGLNEYLQANDTAIVDLQNNPSDPDAGNKISSYIGYIVQEIKVLESKIATPTAVNVEAVEIQRQSVVEQIAKYIRDFVYKN